LLLFFIFLQNKLSFPFFLIMSLHSSLKCVYMWKETSINCKRIQNWVPSLWWHLTIFPLKKNLLPLSNNFFFLSTLYLSLQIYSHKGHCQLAWSYIWKTPFAYLTLATILNHKGHFSKEGEKNKKKQKYENIVILFVCFFMGKGGLIPQLFHIFYSTLTLRFIKKKGSSNPKFDRDVKIVWLHGRTLSRFFLLYFYLLLRN